MAENQNEEIPFLSNVGLMLTYKCTIACPHCIVKAGPNRKEEMTLESAFNWLNQLQAFGDEQVNSISLTGGEPFYNLTHLVEIANYANKQRLIVSVVTNAYWASTKEEALRILEQCSSIQMISVSADISHQEFIPFENVRNAIWAAKKCGKIYNIAVAAENVESSGYINFMDKLLDITDRENINTTITLPVGRAEKRGVNSDYEFSSKPPVAACSMASSPVIFPNGDVIACIGPPITLPKFNPLYLGNLQEEKINEIFERAESNYVLHSIRTFGPKVLVELLMNYNYEKLLPKEYIENAICDVCFKLLSNKEICDTLSVIIEKDEMFRIKTAYGRQYYLNEPEMVKYLNMKYMKLRRE